MQNIRVIAQPGIVRTNRLVVTPKVRNVIGRDVVTKAKIVPVNKVLKSIRVSVEEQKKASVQPQNISVQRVTAVRKVIRTNNVKVRYMTRDIPEESKAKIRALQGVGTGRILVIIGNGPSVTEVDLSKLVGVPGLDIMSINKPDMRVWPSNYWLFCDQTQYTRHKALWDAYVEGKIITSTSIDHSKANALQIKNAGGNGFSKDLLYGYHIGRSSVYAAMQVAMWMNYTHTYILGCDMTAVTINGEKKIWSYGINPDVSPENRLTRFDGEAKHYDWAAAHLSDEERRKYTFCSEYLKYEFAGKYNKISHRGVAERILEHVAGLSL